MRLLRTTLAGVAVIGLTALVSGQAKPSSAVLRPEDRASLEAAGAALVKALNSNQSADWVSLFAATTRASVGADRLTAQFQRIRETTGALEFHHAELAEFTRGAQRSRILHVYARAALDKRWRDFQVAIEPDPPFRFDQLAFIAEVAEPVYLPNADLPDPDTRKWLEQYVDRLAAQEGLSGSVLVTKGTTTLFAKTFGYADAARTQPISTHTRFSMASASKMFTGVLVAKLVEEGRLKYADPITAHLPAAVVREPWSRVTIDHLLSHRSGIGEYWTPDFTAARASVRTLDDFVPWIHKAGQAFAPGSAYGYSNSNFILLGLIIERATKRSFEDELRRALLLPLKLSSTSLVGDTLPASRDAQMLIRSGAGWSAVTAPVRGSSAGGAWTTVEDAAAFMRALAAGRVVSPATLAVMTTARNAGADAFPYGYALEMRTDGGALSFGHGGIARGVNAELRYFPTLDVTLVVFSNQDNGAFDDLKKNVIKLISGAR